MCRAHGTLFDVCVWPVGALWQRFGRAPTTSRHQQNAPHTSWAGGGLWSPVTQVHARGCLERLLGLHNLRSHNGGRGRKETRSVC